MFLCPFSHKFWAVIHAKHGRIATVCRDPVKHPDHSWGWQIQIYFNRQRLTVKVINDIERQLSNGRTATEVMEEQLDRLFPSRVSAGVQGVLGKIDACLFATEPTGFQIPGVHLTCPITLNIPERDVFARTSLQSDVCCLYDSTALKELVSRRLPHPISREAITEAHIVPKEQCHFDPEKGAFIHSASQ